MSGNGRGCRWRLLTGHPESRMRLRGSDFTKDHLFYYPPVEAFEKLVDYANRHGNPRGTPYFSLDGVRPLSGAQWEAMRAKFKCEVGVTNVWREPPSAALNT